MSFLARFNKLKIKARKPHDKGDEELEPLKFLKRRSRSRSYCRLEDSPPPETIDGPVTCRHEQAEAIKPLLPLPGAKFVHGHLSDLGLKWHAFEGMGIDPTNLRSKYLCLWQPMKPDHNGYVIPHNRIASFYRELRLAPDPENTGHRSVHIERAGLNAMMFKVFDPEKDEETVMYLMPKHAFQARATGTIERPEEFVHYLCEEDLRKLMIAEPEDDDGSGKIMIKITDASSGILLGEGVDDVSIIGLQLRGMDHMGYIACGVVRTPFDLIMTDIKPTVHPRRRR